MWYVGLPCSNGWLLRSDIGGWLEPWQLLLNERPAFRCIKKYKDKKKAEEASRVVTDGNLNDGSTVEAVVLSQAELDALLVMERLSDG